MENAEALPPQPGEKPPLNTSNLEGSSKAHKGRRASAKAIKLRPPLPKTEHHSPSSPTSIPSDEEIVFTGRQNAHHLHQADQVASRTCGTLIEEHRSNAVTSCFTGALKASLVSLNKNMKDVRQQDTKVRPSASLKARLKKREKQNRRGLISQDEVENDYIANLQANGDQSVDIAASSLNNYDLGGFDGLQSDGDVPDVSIRRDNDWDSTDLKDFEAFSTSSEEFENVDKIVARRERPSGRQYLMVGVGFTADDARWLPRESLAKSEHLVNLARRFDEEQDKVDQVCDVGSLDDNFGEEAQFGLDVLQAMKDAKVENDFHERFKENMTDDHMARLLAKQEELGMNSDDLILFDDVDDDVIVGACFNQNLSSRKSKTREKKQAILATPQIPHPRTLDQDAFEMFESMIHQQPGVPSRSRSYNALGEFRRSDSFLEKSLQIAWENDRNKKKARRQAREELRAQGLLGKKKLNKPDLRAKYSDGITLENVEEEIKNFLTTSSAEALSLPPMNANARKVIHEAGHLLSLKTKSMGSGKSRFPILYKTSQTGSFDERVFARIQSKFFPRSAQGKKRAVPTAGFHGREGQSTSYRDGEVVGAFAPELGQENKGRVMLERMGWSTGTALGPSNNKGIAAPVEQIVKTTKSGLG